MEKTRLEWVKAVGLVTYAAVAVIAVCSASAVAAEPATTAGIRLEPDAGTAG